MAHVEVGLELSRRRARELRTGASCAGIRPFSTLHGMNSIPRTVLVPSALSAGICPLVANTIHEDAAGDGAQILSEAARGASAAESVSVALFLLGFAALVVVLATLSAAISARLPALAGVVAIAGAASVAVKLLEAQTGIALRQAADALDPGTAELVVGIDEAGFTVHGFLLSLALGAAALGLLRSRVVPSWLAWWGVVGGGLGVLTTTIGIIWPTSYVPIPFLLLLVWLVALGGVGVRRPLVYSASENVSTMSA